MRQLLPLPADVDVLEQYTADDRPAPHDRPWVMVNMIASIDGATAVDGLSGGLGGPADKEVFRAVRSVPDVILVAAGTVRAEGYGPPRPSDAIQQRRRARGQQAAPRLAIVTRSLDLDPEAPLFRDVATAARPLILTTADAAATAPAALRAVADVRAAGTSSVDLTTSLRQLRAEGLASVVLCEGGPSLNGALVEQGLVDELCISVSPLLVGGSSPRLAHGTTSVPARFALTRVLEDDGMLFLRYGRSGAVPAS
jgi:riboflavin biosynthesis pyrimidine reductase